MQTSKSRSSSSRRDLPAGVDEYLQREGLTEEEWERVFDLRYCTILVPKKNESNTDTSHSKQDDLSLHEKQSIEPIVHHQQHQDHQNRNQTQSPSSPAVKEEDQPSTPATPPSILTKHRSNSTTLPPPNPQLKRRRLIDPSLEFDNDDQPAFVGEDSSDDDVPDNEKGQSELGGVSENEGPTSSNDPMFGFLRQPRRSRRGSTAVSSPITKSPSSSITRSFFSKFWRSSSPNAEVADQTESDVEFVEADNGNSTSTTHSSVEVVIIRNATTATTNIIAASSVQEDPMVCGTATSSSGTQSSTSDAMDVDPPEHEDQSMLSEPQSFIKSQPKAKPAQPNTVNAVQGKHDSFNQGNDGAVKQKDMAISKGEHDDANKREMSTSSHWPIPSPTHRLLRERRPRANTDFSYSAWISSPSLGGRSPASSHSLLKPRSFTPPQVASMHSALGEREPLSLHEQPARLRKATGVHGSSGSRRSSLSSDMSSTFSFLSRDPHTTVASSFPTLQRATSSSDDWTNYHWNRLEVLYMQMNGDAMSEDNLLAIVDKFLEEDARHTGQPSRWSRNMIRRRCVALHRIRHSDKRRGTISTRPWEQQANQHGTKEGHTPKDTQSKQEDASGNGKDPAKWLPLTPFTPLAKPKPVTAPNPEALRDVLHPKGSTSSSTLVQRKKARESARPYPTTAVFHRTVSQVSDVIEHSADGAYGGIQSTKSTSSESSETTTSANPNSQAHQAPSAKATSLATLQRQERRKKMKLSQDIYTHKSVFRHKFAEGLKSVKQLLPFWREVERGQGTIQEKLAIPLVPQRKVKTVVDAFETAMDEASMAENNETKSTSGSVSGVRGDGADSGRRMSSVSAVSSMSTSSRRSSVTAASESVAEMLARGHASRMLSAAASFSSNGTGSSSATLVTPSTSFGSQ
ncbi:hypothetical protein BGW42_008221 [Actinomortierella wolfii]|nr:hypothetical protein BGW42_008221 [Actinomortierella wolfii]